MRNQNDPECDREHHKEIPVHIDWYAVTINMLLGGALAMSFVMLGAYFALQLMK